MQSISTQRTAKKTSHCFHKRFILQLQLLQDIYLANIKTGLMRMMTKFRDFFKNNTDCSVSKKAAYSNICKAVQTKLRDMQDSWKRKKTEKIQSFADSKDMKKFHNALKTIYDPKSSGATTLFSADGSTLLTDRGYFGKVGRTLNSLLNRPSSIKEDAIDILPQIECNVLLDEFSSSSTVNWQSSMCRCNSCRGL